MSYTALDFLNTNTLRAFPIRERSSRLSVDSSFRIPDSLLADFMLVGESDLTARYWISRIEVRSSQITLTLSRQTSTETAEVGEFYISAGTADYTVVSMINKDGYPQLKARLTIGKLADTLTEGVGGIFDLSATELEMRTIIPNGGDFVSSIVFKKYQNGQPMLSKAYTGDVVIDLRYNLKMLQTSVENNSYGLYAGENLGLNASCGTGTCIQKINGYGPDASGNITIKGDDACVTVGEGTGSTTPITIQNSCCPPCMGCDQLSDLSRRAIQVETSMLKLRDMYLQLNTHVMNLAVNVNKSCPDCGKI